MEQQNAGETLTPSLGLHEIAFNEEIKGGKPLNIEAITVSGNNDIFVVKFYCYLFPQRLLI